MLQIVYRKFLYYKQFEARTDVMYIPNHEKVNVVYISIWESKLCWFDHIGEPGITFYDMHNKFS